MKYLLIVTALIMTFSCTTKKEKLSSTKKQLTNTNDSTITKETKPTSQTEKKDSIISFTTEQTTFIRNQYDVKDSIQILRFYEEQYENFLAYEYIFKIFSKNTPYHDKYAQQIRFNPNTELKYSTYDFEAEIKTTNDSIKTFLAVQFPNLSSEWVDIELHNGEPTVYDNNYYYYHLTDSLFYDNTYQDGPVIYRYTAVYSESQNKLRLELEEIQGGRTGTLNFYFLSDQLALIVFGNRFSDGSSSYKLTIPISSIYKYNIVALESPEEPIGYNFDTPNYDSLISLPQFN